jgi:hypothetical protein
LITKIFRGHVRSHSLHGPTDTPDQVGGLLAIVCSTYYYTSTNDEGHYLWHEAVRAAAPPPSLLRDVAGCCRWVIFILIFLKQFLQIDPEKCFSYLNSRKVPSPIPHPLMPPISYLSVNRFTKVPFLILHLLSGNTRSI